MTQIEKQQGEYFNYDAHIMIDHDNGSSVTHFDFGAHDIAFDYSVVSNDENTPSENTITIYNPTKTAVNTIALGDRVQIDSGPKNIYGMIAVGNISQIVPQTGDADDALQITF
ncbi:hypothetical protein IV37_GL000193 [Fructilactobacillus fructivorans]|uniref:hypothetical protein n=1 Tax=Fructilactobacillus fructivorans TaxID=1614 RepID=UPI00070515A6|nr:hypothetical protein [Fructilactobacillus fructivorans]KRN13471.1 hypothetical protein IV37_GL000193 [Fructilactobacillus fructivorans]